MRRFPLVLATRNAGKIREIKSMLNGLPVKLFTYHDFPQLKEVKEDGKTLKANAIKKAVFVARATKQPALADDSGLFVKALGGAPGVYSARFAGNQCSYEDNNRKLLKLLGDISASKRTARFSSVIALVTPEGRVKTFRGDLKGWISFTLLGKNGFGYDPIFVVNGFRKTLAELGFRVKNKISHRSQALQKAIKFLKSPQGKSNYLGIIKS